jgi:hypothetical protein
MSAPDIFRAQRLTYKGWSHDLHLHLELAPSGAHDSRFCRLTSKSDDNHRRAAFASAQFQRCNSIHWRTVFCNSYKGGTEMRTLSGIVP